MLTKKCFNQANISKKNHCRIFKNIMQSENINFKSNAIYIYIYVKCAVRD